MSEYNFVEKPFLDQLQALGWQIVDHGEHGVPTDPTISFRTSFREWVLKGIFKQSVKAINKLDDGREWLTDKQLEDLHEQLTNQPGKSLLEANEAVLKLLFKAQVDVNELTGEEYPVVKIIDFDEPISNHFVAINQFRIDTPSRVKDHIRPDIVLFVNGLPLVVVECKDANEYTSNPMHEAVKQLRRYSDQREETIEAGLKEGEERLFHFNQLVIATCGDEATFGTITSTEEHFHAWKDIYPIKYREYTPPLGKERQQETLIQGMLTRETLLDIVRNCTLFMEVGNTRVKIVSRYQQYRAMQKIIDRLRTAETPQERSGVIWHTQGSGKSLTMVFTVRKLRRCEDLKDYKVVMVNDRTDLEEQLGDTAALTGEKVTYIQNTEDLKTKLATPSSDLNMVMIHKFREDGDDHVPEYVSTVLEGREPVPEYEQFGVVNDSERILIMVDEAHRTQASEFGDNLIEAFPNATRLAFTGTPLITARHTKKTWERFGSYIDKYKLQDAVNDGATIQILYEGKTADAAINEKHEFERKFDDLFCQRTDEEILAIKKKYGTTGDILEAKRRIEAIADDLVDHYVDNILPNGFKAQVVSSSKIAAIRYQKYIDQAVARRLEEEQAKAEPDAELVKRIAFLQSVVVVSSEGTNEAAVITQARKHARAVKAVDNFKEKFDYDDPDKVNTGIAFLIVCDMLLTGFDAPVEQVMYIDKKVKEHNLLQTIARVNRVHKGKTRGYIVDYIGLANHLKEALSIYAGDDYDDVKGSLKDIEAELPVLESRYQRLVNLFKEKGVPEIESFVQQTIKDVQKTFDILEDAIQLLKDIKLRATFEVYMKKFMQSMDIVLPHSSANPYKIPAKRFGYLLVKTRERYKDGSLNLYGAGEKVRWLINQHLISLGIDPKIPPIELVSPNFITEIEKHTTPKAKASEMEHAIRKHCKVHFEEDPALYAKLSEKLETLIKKHRDDWEQLSLELGGLRDEVQAGRQDGVDGVTATQAPFYDLIGQIAFGEGGIPDDHAESVKQLVRDVIDKLHASINIINFWSNGFEVNKLKGELADLLLYTGIDDIVASSDKIVTEITALAKVRHEDIVE
ncbi:MAG: type I restriction endonuclease subunit R [Phycisphaerae bacterium]|nr:type I restriction endonuclease subunit R [Phycisphaerae bacterium]